MEPTQSAEWYRMRFAEMLAMLSDEKQNADECYCDATKDYPMGKQFGRRLMAQKAISWIKHHVHREP